jgi:DNA polymerase-4
LRASAGISNSKFVAKIASDVNKPNGQKTIPPEEVAEFLEGLPIEKFFGIGKVTASKMYELGIFTGRDLKSKSLEFLTGHFKNSGEHYFRMVRGKHFSEVKPNRIQKSVAAEHTFRKNLTSEIFMMERLEKIAGELEKRLKNSKVSGKTITLKIKYSDFSIQTRSRTLGHYIRDKSEMIQIVRELLFQEEVRESVRLLGISMSNLDIGKSEEKGFIDVQLKFEF